MKISSYYVAQVDPNSIFGMVGRCGGGYNTVWQDWSPAGRINRQRIMREFEQGIDQINGHYYKLEQSILSDGIRNPTIITRGLPMRRKLTQLPPELRTTSPGELLVCEGVTGGSRLHIAQKHNIPIPCIINDRTEVPHQWNAIKLRTVSDALSHYADKPQLMFTSMGVSEVANTAIPHHLSDPIPEELLIKARGAMWIAIMKKYGYDIVLSSDVRELIYGK